MELNIGLGYAYTHVFNERIYTSLGLFASLGYINSNSNEFRNNFLLRADGRLGLGYNGSKYYSGLFVTLSGTRFKQNEIRVTNTDTRVYFHLFFGIRLDAPNFLKKNINKLKGVMQFIILEKNSKI
ncbi:MAG: DUF4421 family protein [Flavobacteriaceae bacterium]|nr:DUF4421 family protein [Flavobacteriaceae bacterium]